MKGSVLVVLVVLEGPEELVVLGEGLAAPGLGHVEGAVLHLLPPEGHRLLSLVARAIVDQLLQLLVAGELSALLEAQRLAQVVVHVLSGHCHPVLVVHDQPPHSVLVQGLGREGSFACGLEGAAAGLLFLLLFLVLKGQLDLLQVLNGRGNTRCSTSCWRLPVLGKLSALLTPLP